jgi:hypothetical protein
MKSIRRGSWAFAVGLGMTLVACGGNLSAGGTGGTGGGAADGGAGGFEPMGGTGGGTGEPEGGTGGTVVCSGGAGGTGTGGTGGTGEAGSGTPCGEGLVCESGEVCVVVPLAPSCTVKEAETDLCPMGTTDSLCGGAGLPCCCEPAPPPTRSCVEAPGCVDAPACGCLPDVCPPASDCTDTAQGEVTCTMLPPP